VRFKIDENLPIEVSEILIKYKHDSHTVHEESLTGINDLELIEVCKKENRILITLDLDFSDIRIYPYTNTPGIIILRTINQSKNNIISLIDRFVNTIKKNSPANTLWIVEETRIRIRE
jgi:predicted nuclease of predicted toxin-antitoxin system